MGSFYENIQERMHTQFEKMGDQITERPPFYTQKTQQVPPWTIVSNPTGIEARTASIIPVQSSTMISNPEESGARASRVSPTQAALAGQLNSSGQGTLHTQLQEQSQRLETLKGEVSQLQERIKRGAAENEEEEDGAKKGEKVDVPKYYYTQREFWGGASLSYMVYTALALIPITGLLGLDHMYMRSPGTGLLKAVMNLFTLGFWYFYDVVQATTDQESVTEFGVSMPLYGPSGIGAGAFLKEGEGAVDNGSPGAFLLFALATFIAPFGVEYIFAGDWGGFAGKFVMSFLGLGVIYGIINSLELLQHPERVMCRGTRRFWPVTWFAEPVFTETSFGNRNTDTCPDIDGGIGGWFSGIFGNLLKKVPILGDLYAGVTGATSEVARQVKQGASALKKAAELGPELAKGFAAAQAASTSNPMARIVGGGSNDSFSSTILTFTLALVFIGAAFLKGKDVMTGLANKADGRLDDVGSFIWRKKNVFDQPPAAPES